MPARTCLPAVVAALVLVSSEAAHAGSIGTSMAEFLEGKRGSRVGGGECAHVATEALRVAGGEFIRDDDYPNSGDYDWGDLVKKVEYANGRWTDSKPSAKVQVGDILQYRDWKIDYGNTSHSSDRHTSVVAAVSNGMPTEVYEQNIGKHGPAADGRKVFRTSIDLKKLRKGWIRIYRAKSRSDSANLYKFTIVNNTDARINVARTVGNSVEASISLTEKNTSGSFKSSSTNTGSSKSRIVLSVANGGSKVTVANAKGYEVYKSNGQTKIRALSP